MKRLTDVAYWEENWRKRKRPRRLWLYRDFDYETVRLLRRCAASFGGKASLERPRVLEVGAGGSRVLPYLRRKFSFEVFGSDFSLSGCRLLRANLGLQGVNGGVVCEDLFQSSLAAEAFDLVYSSGLIEHFDDTRAVIAEHLRLVRPRGRLVVIVPNYQGVQGRIVRHWAPARWSLHRVLGPADLAGSLKALGLGGICAGYLGSFFIHIDRGPEWSIGSNWPSWAQGLLHACVRVANGLISLAFRLSPLRPHTRALSPACFAVGTKP